jgi:hypothetical protein
MKNRGSIGPELMQYNITKSKKEDTIIRHFAGGQQWSKVLMRILYITTDENRHLHARDRSQGDYMENLILLGLERY